MTIAKPESWDRLQELFEAALECPVPQRSAFVAGACGDDRQLENELLQLLAVYEPAEEELESSPFEEVANWSEDLEDLTTAVPEQIGRYRIRRMIASGGMGTVYEAEQEDPHRTVALKVMRLSVASQEAQRRFQYESQLLSRLRHPGIAQVFEAGTYDDGGRPLPYFAMEYVPDAAPITEYADAKQFGLRARLELFAEICDAVHHGHQKGVIHRDLKPSNILVDAEGHPRVIDFGIARSTNADVAMATMRTETGQLLGTLQYMSPEQCEADPQNVDTRSDVYTLGVVLYELLCGKLPYEVDSLTLHEATRMVCERPPTKLSATDARLRGDVETIVLKAMEKDRDHRYRSASALADDIRRYLAGEAIAARPPSFAYQLRVFARRNKAVVAGVAAVLVALTLGMIGTSVGLVRESWARQASETARIEANRQRDSALKARAEAALQTKHANATADFLSDMLRDILPGSVNGRPTIQGMLDRASQKIEAGRLADQPGVEVGVRNLLALACSSCGRYDEAETHLRRAVEIRRRELGPEHPRTIGAAANLVLTLVEQNKLEEAEQLARKNLQIARRISVEDSFAWHTGGLGLVLLEKGELDEAEPLLRELLARRRNGLGNQGSHVAGAAWALGRLLEEKGELCDAETLLREAVEKHRDAGGDQNVHTGRARIYLGECLAKMGRHEEAQQHLTEGYAIVEAVVGKEHAYGREGIERLVVLYEAWNKPDEAAKWRAMLTEVLPSTTTR